MSEELKQVSRRLSLWATHTWPFTKSFDEVCISDLKAICEKVKSIDSARDPMRTACKAVLG